MMEERPAKSLPKSAVNNPRQVYWDSCIFIALLAGEPHHRTAIQELATQWNQGQITLVTSTLTVAEVLMAKCGPPGTPATRLRPDLEVSLDSLFNNTNMRLINVDPILAREARNFVWQFSIRPKDAIHVASALVAGVDEMHTTDAELLRASGLIGTPAPLTISIPR